MDKKLLWLLFFLLNTIAGLNAHLRYVAIIVLGFAIVFLPIHLHMNGKKVGLRNWIWATTATFGQFAGWGLMALLGKGAGL